jgi:hypothetical protein
MERGIGFHGKCSHWQMIGLTIQLLRRLSQPIWDGKARFKREIPLMARAEPGSGEYGPINHMFPLTPIALHKGWIAAKERTMTAIHGTYVPARLDLDRLRGHGFIVSTYGAGLFLCRSQFRRR